MLGRQKYTKQSHYWGSNGYEKFEKIYKSQRTEKIPAELMHSGGMRIRSEGSKLINSVRNREELPEEFESNRSCTGM
jgi:hypothetical protein